jgi:hypothetical protein
VCRLRFTSISSFPSDNRSRSIGEWCALVVRTQIGVRASLPTGHISDRRRLSVQRATVQSDPVHQSMLTLIIIRGIVPCGAIVPERK